MGQIPPTGASFLTPGTEGVGLSGLGCLFHRRSPRMFCLTQNCCLRYTVGIRCHFFPTHLLPVTLTLREANGMFLQETQASGLNPERAGENLKTLECIFILQAKQTVCGVRDKARRNSKQGMNQNKVGNMHFHPLCYNKALASFSTQGSTWTLETV